MLKLLRFLITCIFLFVGINHLDAQIFKKKSYTSIYSGLPIKKKHYKAEIKKAKKEARLQKKAKKKLRKLNLSNQTKATRKRLKASLRQTKKDYRKSRKKTR